MQRIGLLGGMFNPVHNGHLRIAVECKDALQLTELRILPCAEPPHRDNPGVSPLQRLEMLQAAILEVEDVVADDRELRRAGTSYTIDTLRSVKAEFPQAHLYLIIGSDAFQQLNTWHEWRSILKLSNIVIAQRPDNKNDQLSDVGLMLSNCFACDLDAFLKSEAGKIFSLKVSQLEISSSQIRRLLSNKKSTQFLMPDVVEDYINKNNLYQIKL